MDPQTASDLIEQGVASACGDQVTIVKGGAMVGSHVVSAGEQLMVSRKKATELMLAGIADPGWYSS